MIIKKRKFSIPGRLIGSINKAKIIKRSKGIRTLDFIPQISLYKLSNLLVSIQLTIESEIEVESILFN